MPLLLCDKAGGAADAAVGNVTYATHTTIFPIFNPMLHVKFAISISNTDCLVFGLLAVPSITFAGNSPDSSSRGGGIMYKAGEAAGAAVGSVTHAARTAVEGFREGEAEGEATGQRDVTRALDTAERARERVVDTTAAVAAPVTERFTHRSDVTSAVSPSLGTGVGTDRTEGITTTSIPPSRTTVLPSEAGSRGYDMPAASPGLSTGVRSSPAHMMSEGIAPTRVDRSPRVSEAGSVGGPMGIAAETGLTERFSEGSAAAGGVAAGPMSVGAASPRHTLMQQQQPGVFGRAAESEIMPAGVMSERGAGGVSDVTGETEHYNYDLDSYVSAVKPTRTAGLFRSLVGMVV